VRVSGDSEAFLGALHAIGAEAAAGDPMLVRLADGEGTRQLFQAASESGVRVRHLKPTRRSLEDVFMARMEGSDEG